MPARFFGQFLLERGVISREALLDAAEYQQSINNPLCALAVEKGYLSKDQIKTLDEEQRQSDQKFLKLAVAKKMLTFEQLETLGRLKSEKWIFLGEALVQRKHLTLSQLHEYFDEYKKERSAGDLDLGLNLDNIHEKVIITSLLKITVDIFVHYTKQIVKVVSVEEVKADLDDIAYTFSQRIIGDKNFCYVMALPEPLTLSIASYILQQEVTKVDDMVLDAVSEFVNVIVGNGCARLSMENWKVTAEPPQIVAREMLPKVITANTISVKMKTMKGEFSVLFSFGAQLAN